jgi:hypothetical protein
MRTTARSRHLGVHVPVWPLLAAGLVLAPRGARAADPTPADKETSRNLYAEGMRLLDARDYARAERACGGAHALVRAPTSAVCWARGLEGLGRLIEARDAFLEATHLPTRPDESPAFANARGVARAAADDLAKRIPSVTLIVAGPDAAEPVHVMLDGDPIPADTARLRRSMNAGRHVLVVGADGFDSSTLAVELAEGEARDVEVLLRPRSAASLGAAHTSPPSPLALIALGTGVVGLGVGIVTGLVSASKHSALIAECEPNGECPASAESDLDAFRGLRGLSTVGYIAGVLGTAGGLIMWVTTPSPRAGQVQQTSLWFGPGTVGMERAF